jgi:hypothetical protein
VTNCFSNSFLVSDSMAAPPAGVGVRPCLYL